MSAQIVNCPDKDTLRGYLSGELSLDLTESCETHFANCEICEETLQGLSASDTLEIIAAEALSKMGSETENQAVIEALVERLQNETFFNCDPDHLEDRAAEVTRLFEPATQPEYIGRLGHYSIIELIGAGSTGVVFRAIDEQLHREVALKILRPSLGQPARERFMAEARAAAAIDHPNVITIYHVGVESDLAYMAMQWLPGETMEARLNRVTFMPEDELRKISLEICSGLQAAHEKNLIHRDIKPANIWLSEETDQAIILDFGLARIADDDPQMTNTGMLAGTPNFMSPEQTRGLELDGRSDLFSLGCTMYRAATGKLPFGSTGILATLQSIQNDNPNIPSQLNPHITEDFSDLIACLLEKQPVNRPENAQQLAAALSQPRSRWPFTAPRAAAHPPKPKAPAASPAGGSIRWFVGSMVLVALGWIGIAFGPQVFRIVTDRGELIIETNDENVKIEILSNGNVVAIIDTETDQRINIRSGEYSVQVKDDRNSFDITPNKVVMKRGGRQIVAVTKVEVMEGQDELTTSERQVTSPGISAFTDPNAVYSAERAVNYAKNALVQAEETLSRSEQLHSKGYITQRQLDNDKTQVEDLKRALEDAEEQLRATKQLQIELAQRQEKMDALSERQLDVLRQRYENRKLQYESGTISADAMHEAELEFLDAQMRLLRGESINPSSSDENATAPRSDHPTYDGNTFDEWLRIIKTERNLETVRTGLNALGALAEDSPELQDRAIETVREMCRTRGGNKLGEPNQIVDQLNDFFSYLPPKKLFEFYLSEYPAGTYKSRQQLIFFLLPSTIYENRMERAKPHLEALQTELPEILNMLIDHSESTDDEDERQLALRSVGYALSTIHARDMRNQGGEIKPLDPDTTALISGRINSSKTSDVRTFLSALLLAYQASSESERQRTLDALSDASISPFAKKAIYHSIMESNLEIDDSIIRALIDVYENEELCKELGAERQDGEFYIRKKIIQKFAAAGAKAASALPFLSEIAGSDSSFLRTYAQQAGREISLAQLETDDRRKLTQMHSAVIATHVFHDRYKTLPFETGFFDNPNLSWRAKVDEFVNKDKELRLDPRLDWDTDRNKNFADKMPELFGSDGKNAEIVRIRYESDTPRTLETLRDGTSNTIMLIMTENTVPWMEPKDISMDDAIDLLSNPTNGHYTIVAFYDGSVGKFSKDVPLGTIRAFLTPAGGETITREEKDQAIPYWINID